MNQKWLGQTNPKVKWQTPFFSHFWVTWGHSGVRLWEPLLRVTSGSLSLSYFLCFCKVRSTPTSQLWGAFDLLKQVAWMVIGWVNRPLAMPWRLFFWGDFLRGVTEGRVPRVFHTPVRGTLFVHSSAVTPGPSHKCDITFFVKGRPKSVQQFHDSTVAARRVQSVTVPSSLVTSDSCVGQSSSHAGHRLGGPLLIGADFREGDATK